MPLVLPKSVFLLCPRTATTWARSAIKAGGIVSHMTYEGTLGAHSPKVRPEDSDKYRFTFIRFPGEWLRSRWALGPWHDSLTDRWDADYAIFRRYVDDRDVMQYFGAYEIEANFIGAAHTVEDNLVTALRNAGETFDEGALRAAPRTQNITDFDNLPFEAIGDAHKASHTA